ncbi:hypothetical protein LZD57_06385, partial [Jiella sp. CBK1P-4]|nr:hypothetical protein [Jiella avicenniae]
VKALDEGTFDTVIGDLSFDDKGDVTLPGYVVYEWKDGKYDYVNMSDPQFCCPDDCLDNGACR